MSDLSKANRAAIERWVPIEDEADAVERISRVGSPEGAALEMLMKARGEMAYMAARTTSADDSSSHEKNFAWISDLIEKLVAFITGSDIPLTPALEDLLDQARGDSLEATTAIDILATNRRRG